MQRNPSESLVDKDKKSTDSNNFAGNKRRKRKGKGKESVSAASGFSKEF
jgi:hypothetical protein